MPDTVVGIADLHCGSLVGLCPPNFADHTINGVQRKLWKRYRRCAKEWHKPDWLIVNGDAIDGKARRKYGAGQWTTSLIAQADCAAECISLWKPKHIVVLIGSDYHVDNSGEVVEEHLGRAVGAEHPGDGWEPYLPHTGLEIDLVFWKTAMHFAHHLGFTRVWQYRSTAITRDMLLSRLGEKQWTDPGAELRDELAGVKRDYLIRAHVHYFWHVEATNQHGFILPGWQAMTPFMKRKSLTTAPDVGAIRWHIGRKHRSYEKLVWKVRQIQPTPTIVARRAGNAD